MNNRIYHSIKYILILVILTASCEDYLDKSPDSEIDEGAIFTNFLNFQGFVEELYNCITDYDKAVAPNRYLYADETLMHAIHRFDQGDYWGQGDLLYATSNAVSTATGETRNKRVWPLCWYGIRKANIGLSNLDLFRGTQEERDLLEGQMLYFRGWFHFEVMRYWGGMPYVDTLLTATSNLHLPRLNYRETALKAAKDFEQAAILLPVDWDGTNAGQRTLGDNRQRISKVHALAYLGKNLLYAASPMMNEESTNKNEYDTELCKKAAEAFAEVLKISEESGKYQLQTWETWTDNFWVMSLTDLSGGTEVILNPPPYQPGRTRTNTLNNYVPVKLQSMAKDTEVPTHNYVKNYAMANGLPIYDPDSGYDPDDPWVGREPRFYADITVDRDELTYTNVSGSDKYAQLFTGGRHRDAEGSVTGYYFKRFSPKGCNLYDQYWNRFQEYIPYMRLADIYLMYAEAVLHGYGSPASSVPGFDLTAVDAINVIRNRAQLPDLTNKYAATKEAFMGEIIRERAVELAFEGHRFHDLRRWNIHDQLKYREKTAVDFDRDPVTGKPRNIRERVIITRVVEKKHNWLPLQLSDTYIYPHFGQNPGW